MARGKSDLSIPWPFAPSVVKLNNDTNLLKVIAMIAMLCDHAGKMLFPQYRILRIIGRMAFPIYAYCLAVGCVYTKNPLRYLGRIVLLALVVQPLYAVSMGHSVNAMYSVSFAEKPIEAALNFYIESWTKKPSILVALAVGMLLIWTLRERQLVFTAALVVFIWHFQGKLDYGWKGIVLMVLFYVFASKRWLSLPCVLAFMLWWGMQGTGYELFGIKFSSQIFAIMSLPLIYIRTNTGIRLPKWLFYAFYPAHLALIFVLDKFVM
ncbi:MAG: hypothetical protein IJ466_04160 [Clostridia bacterium]|nr:hypothetical protein [Clostridia bacterium]